MPDRYLIINADDFGICRETNEAIENLFNDGRITSTTIMAPCRSADDALSRAGKNKRIKMGLHITLNSDMSQEKWHSISSVDQVRSLLDEDGSFHFDTGKFYSNATGQEVAAEINAQYNFVVNAGLKPTHADSHCGTLYGLTGKPFIKEAFELCASRGLPFRLPKSKDFIIQIFGGKVPAEIDAAHTNAVLFAQKLGIGLPDNMITNSFSISEIKSYEKLKEFYLNVVRNLKEGVTELFLHPSKENSQYMSYSAEWQKRIWEYQILLEDDILKTVQQDDIKLVSWDNAPLK